MSSPIFSARFEPTNSTTVSPTTWDVTGTVFDGTGEFSGMDVLVGDVVFLDCFASITALNTVGRYLVTQINSQSPSSVNVRVEWDDTGAVVDPIEVLNTFGFIARSSTNNGFAWHAAPSLHNIPDYVVQYSRNKELKDTIDVDLGTGGGGDGLTVTDVTLSSAQILALHTTPITLVSAPGAGMYHAIDSAEIFLVYNSAPYTGGADLIIDYLSNPNNNFALDGGCVTAGTNSRRYGEPVDNPLPDTADLAINEAIVISTTDPFLAGDSTLKVRLRYKTYTALT